MGCRKKTLTAIFLILLCTAGLLKFSPRRPSFINNKIIFVEIAATPKERAIGLQGRKTLAENQGMLFVFEREEYPRFWMKNTYVALSIAFLDAGKMIVDIQDMEPLNDKDFHVPAAKSKYALEMPRGWFEKHKVNIGDRVWIWL
ncbi:MAG: DUF192 domain-containing protein [Candidatus Omnitrophica bacterium]|nr:DUF192 domain-containing protein [Candidatus Omnitrophota bacterium]MBU1925593.1 DUF192 domain-containing protein [Candidatus Omnitrophota bacterium]